MQKRALIFTERRLLPRIIDILLSAIAWAGFLWLIYKGAVNEILHKFTLGSHPCISTIGTLILYIAIAALNSCTLIFWAKYNQIRFQGNERRNRKPGLEQSELATSLNISEEILTDLSRMKKSIIYHNKSGDITEIKK